MMKNIALGCIICLFSSIYAVMAHGEEKLYRATIDNDGIQRVEIVAGGYFFEPNRIFVKANVPVEIKIRKESGIVPHNFMIKAPEAGIDIELPLGSEQKVARFVPSKPGMYPFYCSKKLLFFESHREKGMEGTLEVVE